jgi:hypothetical protein
VRRRAADGDGANSAPAPGVTAAQYGTIQDSPPAAYNFLQGGNPNLAPRKPRRNTIGLVCTPNPQT